MRGAAANGNGEKQSLVCCDVVNHSSWLKEKAHRWWHLVVVIPCAFWPLERKKTTTWKMIFAILLLSCKNNIFVYRPSDKLLSSLRVVERRKFKFSFAGWRRGVSTLHSKCHKSCVFWKCFERRHNIGPISSLRLNRVHLLKGDMYIKCQKMLFFVVVVEMRCIIKRTVLNLGPSRKFVFDFMAEVFAGGSDMV